MRTIENKTTKISTIINDKTKETKVLTYSDLIKSILSFVPQGPGGGILFEEMEKKSKIRKIVDGAKKEIMLEDDQYKTLIESLKIFKWAFQHDDVVTFCNDLKNAKTVAVNKA